MRLGSLRRQPALRLRGFRLSVECDELCGATVTGTVRIEGSKRVYVLARIARQLAAGKRARLDLRASYRARRAIRSALHRGRGVTATLAALGRDAAGNAGRAERIVRARF